MIPHADDRYDEAAHAPRRGQELLWCLRTWIIWTSRDYPAEARIRVVLADAGASDAADPLFALMRSIGQGVFRPLTIACVCDQEIGDDERLLLDVVALQQDGRSLEAMLLLRSILPAPGAVAAQEAAERLAAALLASGHWLAAPEPPAVHQYGLVTAAGWRAGMH